jgi:uncharacterized membrane protein YebE (DUF533 family)
LIGGQQGGGGGLADILGGGGQSGGGLGGLLDGLGGGGSGQQSGGGLGDLPNAAIGGQGSATLQPTQEQDQQAEVLIRAMISAAKSDGAIDKSEQEKIAGQLNDATPDEVNFVRQELSAPLDFDGLVRSVPRGMEQQVYLMSLMAIDLDSQSEARYLDQLAQRLGISHEASNQIHQQLGAPQLYQS